jgi:bifunctional DNase/RNase
MLHKAKIEALAIEPSQKAPVIILKTEEGENIIPIWIGQLEATSIAYALSDIKFDRPLTHDLFKNFLGLLDIYVSQVDICDLKDNTYFGEIHFISKDNTFSMDARPSDAIAMAIRFNAPIYVDDKVISESSVGKAEALVKTKDGEIWADYLKNLSPDDFGKYKV